MVKVKKIGQFLRRLTVFDWLVVVVILFGLVFLAMFVFKKEKWVKVEVVVSHPAWWWESKDPPYWLVDSIKKGDKQHDALGRTIAEVLEIESWGTSRKTTFLTLNVKAEINRRKKKLIFNHRPLEIGREIGLEIGNVGVDALVTFVEGMPDDRIWGEKVVETRVSLQSEVFPETLGIMPWVAEAIKINDQMENSKGEVLAEVLDRQVRPAEKIVTTADGRLLVRQDPIKKDVILRVKLKTFEQKGTDFFLYGYRVKVGANIFLSLPQVDVWPEITRIIE